MTAYADRLRAAHWEVRSLDVAEAKSFVEQHHYARGVSRTAVYVHGLFLRCDPVTLLGVAWWLPPTRVACESVDRERWTQVLSLSRLVVAPNVPKNACSFLVGRGIRQIKREGRFVALVTYADEYMGHDGGVYRSLGFEYVGRTGPYAKWIDPKTNRQVATQATTSRTKAEMEALGYAFIGRYHKHKYVRRLS